MSARFGDLTFTVEVEYTDRTRTADGRYRVFPRTVEVLAPNDVEAVCVAAQIVDTMRRDAVGGMVLSARVSEVVT